MKSIVNQAKKEVPRVISVDEVELKQHLSGIVRASVEEALNALLDAEADALCLRHGAMSGLQTDLILAWVADHRRSSDVEDSKASQFAI